MSDILNIRVTKRELDLIMDLLHEAGERPDADGNPAIEICHDLMEQSGRSAEIEPTEIEENNLTGFTFTVAEDQFINAGIAGREHLKASGSPPRDKEVGTSRAAMRRANNLGAPRGHYDPDVFMSAAERIEKYAKPDNNDQLSETQRFDLWDDRDPKNW